jgi:toxin ParE1/3/4
MKLEFHPEAEVELLEAAEYYELQVPGLGERFGAEVRRATDLLLLHPELGAPVDADLRNFVLSRFPFTLIYSASPAELRVEAWHISVAVPATGARELAANDSRTY